MRESARLFSVHLFSKMIIALQNTKAIWNLFDSLIIRIDCKGHQNKNEGTSDECDEKRSIRQEVDWIEIEITIRWGRLADSRVLLISMNRLCNSLLVMHLMACSFTCMSSNRGTKEVT